MRDDLQNNPDYASATWALVAIDITKLSAKPERFNVSWPEFVLHKVDKYIAERHESRSGFLARAALEVIEKETHHAA